MVIIGGLGVSFEDAGKFNVPEELVRGVYDSKGYNCIKIDSKGKYKEDIPNHIVKQIQQDASKDLADLIRKGVPDFLVYGDSEYYFIEVKRNSDTLKQDQVEWLLTEDVRSGVALVIKKDDAIGDVILCEGVSIVDSVELTLG